MVSIYRVYNQTRGMYLDSETELAETLWARMRGLLGRKDLLPGEGVWLRPAQGVHTIGMRCPSDVAYLDGAGRVVKMYHRLAPFRIAALSVHTRSVLELSAGALSRNQMAIGDRLEFFSVK